jgi:hypothetical protein
MNHPSPADTIARHADRILAIPGVVGIAEGLLHGQPCIQIHLAVEDEALKRSLPVSLDGYPVVTMVTGEAELF